jgi:type II secretory pathway pseudopilin PulG
MIRRRAISLLEVVVAMVIMAIAIPPLFIQIAADVQQQEAFLVQRNLTHLASERLWEIYADHADPDRGFDHVAESSYPGEADAGGLTGYVRTTEVLEVSDSDYVTQTANSGVKRCRVTVTAPDGRTITIESFVAQLPTAGE